MSSAGLPDDMIFILGVERSGTTWVGNILDSSSDVDYYAEPFARHIGAFPSFPHRLTYLTQSGPYLNDMLREGLNKVSEYKYYWLEEPDSSPFIKRFVETRIRVHSSLLRRLGGRPPSIYRKYRELHLGRRSNEEVLDFSTQPVSPVFAMKELRLNLKVHLLNEVFPKAQVLVVVRNPLAQVSSILRLMRNGSLLELRESLHQLFEVISSNPRFERLSAELERLRPDSMVDRAILYWVLNYSILLRDLKSLGMSHLVVRHEDLCEDPPGVTKSLFEFLDLPVRSTTMDYIRASSQTSGTSSPTDTSRKSNEYYKKALQQCDPELVESFWKTMKGLWDFLPAELSDYNEWLMEFAPSTR